jgi:hypothetical protein
VAPPSLHASGARYCWVDVAAPLAPCPEWLVWALQPPPPRRPPPPLDLTDKGRTRYGQVALERAAERILAAPDGQHDWTVNAVAFSLGRLVGGGLLDEDVATAVLADATGRLCPRLHDTASGLAAGKRQPRTLAS